MAVREKVLSVLLQIAFAFEFVLLVSGLEAFSLESVTGYLQIYRVVGNRGATAVEHTNGRTALRLGKQRVIAALEPVKTPAVCGRQRI